jgi:Leucine-rich repeat (LRR) protein
MHHNFKRLAGLSYFVSLLDLSIVNQGIEKIEGLDSLVNLKRLWLNENRIRKIEGLTNCKSLTELYLYVLYCISGLSLLTVYSVQTWK